MTLQVAVEKAMKIIAKYGDELDYVRIVEGGCWFQLEANEDTCEGYFSVAIDRGDLSRHLCLKQEGNITPQSLLSDKWEINAIRNIYVKKEEIEVL